MYFFSFSNTLSQSPLGNESKKYEQGSAMMFQREHRDYRATFYANLRENTVYASTRRAFS